MIDRNIENSKFWNDNPIGSKSGLSYQEGTIEYFDAISRERYKDNTWIYRSLKDISFNNKKVLEIGCGMGMDLLHIANRGAIVHAIDLTTKHVKLAKLNFVLHSQQAEIELGNAEKLSYADNTMDIIYSCGVIHHVANPQKAISEIHRVLKPNGLAIISVYSKYSWHTIVNLLFIQGILNRQLFKMSFNDILASGEESPNKTEHKPLIRVWSKNDCNRLFKKFSKVRIKNYHWRSNQVWIPLLSRFIPDFDLPDCLGWYLTIYATK